MNFLIFLLYCAGAQGAEINVLRTDQGKKRCLIIETNISRQIEKACRFAKVNEDKDKPSDSDMKYNNMENPINDYYRKRHDEIESLKKGPQENNPYPSNIYVSKSLDEFYTNYLKSGNVSESLAGRVYDIGKNSLNETVYDMKSENDDFTIQVIVNARTYNSSNKYANNDINNIKRGDIIGVIGWAGEKQSEKLTLHAQEIRLLAPCLHEIPLQSENKDRFTLRSLDFIMNEKSKRVFHQRAKVISTIRRFLENLGFLEVETPILNKIPGGAKARSFKTHYDYENSDLHLRISPELYHKLLIVGGFNKIFEIGRQFRNERTDLTHNPEFTSLEFYTTYVNFTYLFLITESLLSDLVLKVHGSHTVNYKGSEIDFQGPYPRIPMIPTLEERLNITFPSAESLNSIEANNFLYQLCIKYEMKIPAAKTSANLLGKLFGKFILSDIVQPTFVVDYPEILSPLAKSHPRSPGLTERFELYALGKELANAYVELNDPQIQRERFAQQDADRVAGDDEIPPTDEEYITALEYGLPPTAGFGMGIDRMVMFLTNATSIKDVILFPSTKT